MNLTSLTQSSKVWIALYEYTDRNEWDPVTTAWRVPTLRVEQRPPIWRVAANILHKQSRTADKG